MHDHSKRKALGLARLKVEHKGNKHELNFVIVDQEVTPFYQLNYTFAWFEVIARHGSWEDYGAWC